MARPCRLQRAVGDRTACGSMRCYSRRLYRNEAKPPDEAWAFGPMRLRSAGEARTRERPAGHFGAAKAITSASIVAPRIALRAGGWSSAMAGMSRGGDGLRLRIAIK